MTQQEIETLLDGLQALKDDITDMANRANPYPESVFPEPDWQKVRTALSAVGITTDRVAGAVGRKCYDTYQQDVKATDTDVLDNAAKAFERLAILEAAVAWHGWDEVPEGGRERCVTVEAKRTDGKTQKVFYCKDEDVYKVHGGWRRNRLNMDEYGFTGWRYPVGDLSE